MIQIALAIVSLVACVVTARLYGLLRGLLFGLLALVGSAAGMLSFDALRALALLADFSPDLTWLLPVVVDTGAAAGTLVWLARLGGHAESFGRVLALVLLASSVAGNAVSHGLQAYGLLPPWWLVVAVSAIAPAVLGAVVHLAVLVGGAGVSSEVSERLDALDTVSDTSDAVSDAASTTARDRAMATAAKHRDEHGDLPSVRALMSLAEVSRGTAADALSPLRNGTTASTRRDTSS